MNFSGRCAIVERNFAYFACVVRHYFQPRDTTTTAATTTSVEAGVEGPSCCLGCSGLGAGELCEHCRREALGAWNSNHDHIPKIKSGSQPFGVLANGVLRCCFPGEPGLLLGAKT